MESEKPIFNWKDFEISPEEAEKAQLLVDDKDVMTTFIEAFDLLKIQRRNRKISLKDFTKALIEIST